MDTWLGASSDDLARQLGPPSAIVTLDNGNRLFIYTASRSLFVPSPSPYGSSIYYPQLSCRTQYEVSHSHRIVGWSTQGACR